HQPEHDCWIAKFRHGDQRQAKRRKREKHPRRARVARGKPVREPTPEEISDFPSERRQPENSPELPLRETEHLREIQRREIENQPDRKRAQRVRRDEAPESPLENIRRRDALRLPHGRDRREIDSAAPEQYP